jgi:arylsulfatase A-like enzyme
MNKLLGILLLGLLMISCNQKKAKTKDTKPNVLFILTDDQRFDALGSLTNNEVLTPNMDKLSETGISFRHAQIMGSLGDAVCLPSRTMIMTGKHVFQLKHDGEYIPQEDILLPEVFKNNGYQTFATGKWHNPVRDFVRSFTDGDNIFFGGMHGYESGGHFRPYLRHFSAEGDYKKGFWGDHFSSEYYADATIDFLGKTKDKQEPFFAFVAFTSPHDPRTPPAPFDTLYKAEAVKLPANFYDEHPFDNGGMHTRDERFIALPRDSNVVKDEIGKYYGMITEVDHQIGRIIEALKASGKYDNTIIVFAGDNGLAMGQHGLMGKQNLYDHSIRVPLVISGPGIPQNKVSQSYCYLSDLYPTLCDLSSIKKPATINGISLVEAINSNDENHKVRDYLFSAYSNVQRAIRKDEFKLICYNVNGKQITQLFNIKDDPKEMINLANNSNYHPKVIELTNLLMAEMERQNDFCVMTKDGWGYPNAMPWKELRALYPGEK